MAVHSLIVKNIVNVYYFFYCWSLRKILQEGSVVINCGSDTFRSITCFLWWPGQKWILEIIIVSMKLRSFCAVLISNYIHKVVYT